MEKTFSKIIALSTRTSRKEGSREKQRTRTPVDEGCPIPAWDNTIFLMPSWTKQPGTMIWQWIGTYGNWGNRASVRWLWKWGPCWVEENNHGEPEADAREMKEEELTESGDLLHVLGKKCKSKYTLADLLIMEEWTRRRKPVVRYHIIITTE